MTVRLGFGLPAVGLLSLLLRAAAAPSTPDSRLRATTVTVVLDAPVDHGTGSTVVVQLPPASTGAAPVLLVRRLDARYVAGAPYQEGRGSSGRPGKGTVLSGHQLAGDPSSLVLDGQTAPTPTAFVLLAVGLGLLVLRKVILLLHRTGRHLVSGRLLQDVHATGGPQPDHVR
jgi:hypothetical protein